MQYKVYSPEPTYPNTSTIARCVVELTTEDLRKAVLLYAAHRDEYLPHGDTEVKPGRTEGTFIMTIQYPADEV